MRKKVCILSIICFILCCTITKSTDCNWTSYRLKPDGRMCLDGCQIGEDKPEKLWFKELKSTMNVGIVTTSDYAYICSNSRLLCIIPETGEVAKDFGEIYTYHQMSIDRGKLFCWIITGELVCIDTKTNEIAWQKKLGILDAAEILADEGYVVVSPFSDEYARGDEPRKIYCVNGENGDIVWKKNLSGSASNFVISNKKLIYTGYFKENPDDSIFYTNLDDGSQIWSMPRTGTDSDFSISDTRCYYVSINEQNEVIFTCRFLSDGKIAWQNNYGKSSFKLFYSISDMIYLFFADRIIVLDKETGKNISEKSVPCIGYKKTILFDNYTIFIGGTNSSKTRSLYCYDVQTNQMKWILEDIILKDYFIANNYLFVFDNISSNLNITNKGLYCFDLSGKKRDVVLKYIIDMPNYRIGAQEIQIDQPPIILNYRTYMPARYLLEPLGGTATWDSKDRKITCMLRKNDGKIINIEMWLGNNQAKLNGTVRIIDENNPKIVPILFNNRTMVPLRFLAESLGCKVDWKADTKEIIVTYQP